MLVAHTQLDFFLSSIRVIVSAEWVVHLFVRISFRFVSSCAANPFHYAYQTINFTAWISCRKKQCDSLVWCRRNCHRHIDRRTEKGLSVYWTSGLYPLHVILWVSSCWLAILTIFSCLRLLCFVCIQSTEEFTVPVKIQTFLGFYCLCTHLPESVNIVIILLHFTVDI